MVNIGKMIEEADMRFILALILVLALIGMFFVTGGMPEAFVTLVGMVVTHYFAKSDR